MKTLHIVPGDSAGGSLKQALLEAGRDEEFLCWGDDLSCGPIDPNDEAVRAAWWEPLYPGWEIGPRQKEFWKRVAAADEKLVVWFSRHSAREFAFFLALADRLGERAYDILDVTELQVPFTPRNGSGTRMVTARAVSLLTPDGLISLFEQARPVTPSERGEASCVWRRLKAENAPFRVVTETGMVSAPVDHFDASLLKYATGEWQKLARVIGAVLAYHDAPFMQVNDIMLRARAAALVEAGELVAEGDPWQMQACRVRLARSTQPP